MSLLVLFPSGIKQVIRFDSFPGPFRWTYKIQAANTDELQRIPNCVTYLRLYTTEAAGFHYAVDLATAGGTTGDGLVLRTSTERKHVLPPGAGRYLHLRSTALGAEIEIECH